MFASVSQGSVQWHKPDGTLVSTLSDGGYGYTTGSAFDSSGNLYVTNLSLSQVDKYDNTGSYLGTFGGGYSTPESILFDAAGHVYVGNLGGFVLKFAADGTQLASYATGRVDWMDLAADQCTLFFDEEGGAIHRYDVCADQPLSDFSTEGGDYALRLLDDGGLLVADESQIDRLDAAGHVVQSYNTPTPQSGWFALNLDPDGTSFWSGSYGSGDVVRFDIVSGTVISSFNTNSGANSLYGLSVFGERTQATQPNPCAVNGLAGPTIAKQVYDGYLTTAPVVKDPHASGPLSGQIETALSPTNPVGHEAACAVSLADDAG